MSNSVRPHRWQPTRLPRSWGSPGKNTGVGCHFLLQCMKVKSESEVAQSCPTPGDPMDGSLPGSSIHGIFLARVLEWIWSDLKKKNLCPPGIYILEYMQINMLKYVEDGKGYEEKSNWARDWGHSEWLNEELSILNQPFTESFSDNWRTNLNKVKKRVRWSSLWRVSMARQKQWKLQRLKKKNRTDLEDTRNGNGPGRNERDWEH